MIQLYCNKPLKNDVPAIIEYVKLLEDSLNDKNLYFSCHINGELLDNDHLIKQLKF